MAPWFGASTIVWANTIATVLVALSIGYFLGGRIADRNPTMAGLSRIVLGAAVLMAIVPFISGPFLRASTKAFEDLSAGIFAGSLVGVGVLIAVPVLLLGMISPYAVRLSVEHIEDAGRISGRLYAIGTVGSLTGTFLAALLLIPVLGSRRTFLIFALALALIALPGLGRTRPVAGLAAAVIVVLMLLPVGLTKSAGANGKVIWEKETAVPVRPGDRADRRHPNAGAQRGPGRALARTDPGSTSPAATGTDDCAPVRRPRLRQSGSPSSAAPPARRPERWPTTPPASASTPSRSTPTSLPWAGRSSTCTGNEHPHATPRTPGRGCRRSDQPVRRDPGRRLPPALHPLLPDHPGVLRPGPRPPRRPGGVVVVNVGHPADSDTLEKVLTATMRRRLRATPTCCATRRRPPTRCCSGTATGTDPRTVLHRRAADLATRSR